MGQSYIVSGFIFTDEASAQIALKEKSAVDYLSAQIEKCAGNKLFAIYNQLLDKNMFHSSVGVAFLSDIRERLMKECGYDEADLKALPKIKYIGQKQEVKKPQKPIAAKTVKPKESDVNKTKKSKKIRNKPIINSKANSIAGNNKSLIYILSVYSIILTVSVCIMFYIVSTINSPHILNYEEVLLNKYSSWEQELTERERIVTMKEKALNIER